MVASDQSLATTAPARRPRGVEGESASETLTSCLPQRSGVESPAKVGGTLSGDGAKFTENLRMPLPDE